MKTPSKHRNREKLLDQGVSLLMARGYHGTGLKEILEAVNVPKGSFYNYFESKEDFGARVAAHYIEPFIQQVDAHLNRPGEKALNAMRHYYDTLVHEQESRNFQGGCLLGNLMGEIGDTSEICRQSLNTAVTRYRDSLCRGFKRAQKEGDARRDMNAEAMADLLLDAWQGALLRMKIEQSSYPLKTCIQHLLGDYFKKR